MSKPLFFRLTKAPGLFGVKPYLLGGMGVIGLHFASVGLGFLITVLISRGLGPSSFGVFVFAITLSTTLALPLTGGLPTLLLREIAASRAREEAALRAGVIAWGIRFFAGVTAGLWALFALSWWLSHFFNMWPWKGDSGSIAVLVVLLVPAMGLLQIFRGILAGHDRVVLSNLGEQLFRPALMVLVLLFFGGLIWPLDSQGVLGLQLIVIVTTIGFSGALVRYCLPRHADISVEIKAREWLWALLPLTAITTTTIFKNHTDILMLGVMADPSEVGVYRIAAQVAILATVVMQILRALSAPRIAAAYAKNDRETMQRHFVRTGRAMLAASALFVLAFALAGESALTLIFGPDYVAAWAPCLALAIGGMFSSACGLVGMALQVTRHAGLAARSAVISAVINVMMNFALIPIWGALGAAIATSLALVSMQVQQWWIARRVLGMRTDALQRTLA